MGDAALDVAWGSYCQQANLISWMHFTGRAEDFLMSAAGSKHVVSLPGAFSEISFLEAAADSK